MDDNEKEINKLKLVYIIVLGNIALFVLTIAVGYFAYKHQHTFTLERWTCNPERRVKIVDDMLTKHNLLGLTEAEVTFLLGEDNSDYGYFDGDNNLVYCLGDERGFISIDREWLIITIDNGIVCDFHITTD